MADNIELLAKLLQKGRHKVAFSTVRPFPHAFWTCGNGRQVLVDRHYEPIWQRSSDGVIT